MRSVYVAENLIDAHLVKHALEAEGIPAWVRGEALTGGIGELGVFGLVGVMVPDLAVPRARQIIAELHLGEQPGAVAPEADEGLPGALPA
ncbi:DUF2007 domain-containing protein [Thermomonas sp.]|uniref:putative signal transducing protein n=1 Tax=Thermomonas sp. TaxID=1971895 RepID=UPI002636161B|nr:DUF2007 domain-containing protein [Thermomonas sp.]MCO5055056.1 DUF2007 domain-containing protein [Thermomonas sp.]